MRDEAWIRRRFRCPAAAARSELDLDVGPDHAYGIRGDVLRRRLVEHLSTGDVEDRPVPRAGDPGALQPALRQRAAAVRAGVVKRVVGTPHVEERDAFALDL